VIEPVPLETLLSDLRGLLGAARARAAANINSELVMLAVAKSLTAEFGHGFSKSTLSRASG
jgi:hypothetical protein